LVFCQNWEISQSFPEDTRNDRLPPEDVVAGAARTGCSSIAYTYSEPSVFYEYAYDSAKLALGQGIRNVLVTAGFLNRRPLEEIAPYIAAANVDYKGDAGFYRKYVKAEIKPVQDYLKLAKKLGIHVEVTNLVIPTLNDSRAALDWLVKWVLDELGPDVPLHLSRFFPMYKLTNLYPTPTETLMDAAHRAYDLGMHYVYVGNVPSGEMQNTRCPRCGETVIVRRGYRRPDVRLEGGRCPKCGNEIPGVWR
jgi:pyruvate formate lyase activating enzyme